ncbi:something about silencing protein 10 [Coemansia biformis]|uniref:Something about silencing protein 10 n=1 Tax=Coemansia biformis TaxID=1286918 RepID=A0A9W7Y6K6_9FUNG|nr:something about silencing protein 10 [Coemansia biformis]
MARRPKKRAGKAVAPVDEEELVRRGASVRAIKTWADVEHESADEFDASKDKVLVEYDKKRVGSGKRPGRRGGASDDESDEEVLGVRAAASSAEDSDGSDGEAFYSDDDRAGQPQDGAWGKQKYNYYDADDIGTDTDDDEAAAQEEEEEALRLQKKQLEALDEGDFIDEFGAQLGVGAKGPGGISRLVSSAEDGHGQPAADAGEFGADGSYSISDAKRQALLRLPEKDRLKVIQAESPELLSLVKDMKAYWAVVRDEVKPILDRAAALGVRPDDHPALAFYTAQYQLLTSYLNNIAVYLVAKASTAEERGEIALRDHPVIGGLVEFRRRLEMMDALQTRLAPLLDLFADELASGSMTAATADGAAVNDTAMEMASEDEAARPAARAAKRADRAAKKADRTADRRKGSAAGAFLEGAAPPADSYTELQAMLKKGRAAQRKKGLARKAAVGTADWRAIEDGDLGDQEQLEEEDAEDKERAMRRLRHHAKRVVQARGKREARDKMSGDMDVPYKDRRAERLRYDDQTAAAVRAEAKKHGDDLDMGMDLDSDVGEPGGGGDSGDYYNEVVRRQAQKKAEKAERQEAQWRMAVEDNVAEEAAVEGGGKRKVNYQILKNKGLQPRRTKEQRNPRVKRRVRYEKAKKKLGSTVAQVRALDGGYGGEATGIKPGLTRSTRFG